jgi:hypothetical protein
LKLFKPINVYAIGVLARRRLYLIQDWKALGVLNFAWKAS